MSPSPNEAAASHPQQVSLYAAHQKIYARSVKGRFVQWRWAFVWLTQLVFYGLPWLVWNNRQAVLFDLEARRFYIFGLVLYPQDFIYLTALLLLSAYSLFLFTAVAGRLWCGYACPQTVYSEMFMWIERRIEGDRPARMKLDAAPWSGAKLARKSGKQAAWVALALFTGFSFVGYFTPVRELAAAVSTASLSGWESFWVLFYGLATYGNAGFLREQVCKYMCPYARFQSAMFDKDTLIITYDTQRGEPRGARSRQGAEAALGACVDCGLCVQVCPTGIDIRKGLQYECIGCAACVDACDGVMRKLRQPTGLVRYDTQNGMAQGLDQRQLMRRVLRPRVLVYSAVLVLITVAVGISLFNRMPFKVDVVRDRATLARIVEDGQVENVYRLQLMNATERRQTYRIEAEGLNGLALSTPVSAVVEPTQARWVTVALRVPAQTAQTEKPGAHEIHFRIEREASVEDEARSLREKSTFVLPR
ncbi:MAG: cytochrome c oxidase accessory protein CcoG [Rubrivivax sp.]|nr:cytochrome c oxidase accessory protein CcoG [Rubrivivax sp.]